MNTTDRAARAGPHPLVGGAVRAAVAARGVLAAGTDLVVPRQCAGCGTRTHDWCPRCGQLLIDSPILLRPRVALPVDAWATGRYRGVLRGAILARKESGRHSLTEPLGDALAHALICLARWGELPDAPRIGLIPAPTRILAARRRGGDPVTAISLAAARRIGPRAAVTPTLFTRLIARDSAGLGARDRRENLRGAIGLRSDASHHDSAPALTVLVDDVLTTGATAAESIRVLHHHGIDVAAVVVLAGA